MWARGLAALIALAGTVAEAPRIPTVADPIVGLDLWRGARVGMDLTQVERLFPAAAPPRDAATLTGGEIERLQIPDLPAEGGRMSAHFFFREAGLVAVELDLPDLAPAASARNLALVKGIAARLASRYGPGYDCGDRSLGDLTAFECKWLKPPLSVRLWYMDTAGQAPLFYLAYRQADDPGYDL